MGDKFTIDKFIKYVEGKLFIPYDGIGYFGTETEESREPIRFDVKYLRKMRWKYTHVYWYNR